METVELIDTLTRWTMDTLVTYLLWAAPLVLVPDVLHSRGNFPPRGEIAKPRSSYTSRGKTDTPKENEVEMGSPYRSLRFNSSQLAETFLGPF